MAKGQHAALHDAEGGRTRHSVRAELLGPDVTVLTVSQFRPLKGRVSLVGSAPLDTVTVPVNVTIDNYLAPSSRISPTSYS